ncbi:MAG: histidine kinase [Bacteroidales bacterium]|nr:histidine kinase [Bacteroidales bacterium]
MIIQRLSYRNAFYIALAFTTFLNVIFLLMFFYIRSAAVSSGTFEYTQIPISTPSEIVHLVINFISVLGISFVLCAINFKLLTMEHIKPKIRVLLVVVSTIVVVIFSSALFANIQIYLEDFGIWIPFRGIIIRDTFVGFFIVLISLLAYVFMKQQQTALENEILVAENMRTRYNVLKNQVDPHFLFNSLNTLNTLIKIDADKAQQYVQELSLVFRYTLQNKEVIPLEEELKFTQAYCNLMQIRYGESLKFEYKVNPKFYSRNIIPLSLQVLVENAIKHNVITTREPLTVSIVSDDKGSISVSNPIRLKTETESGEGIGLINLSERYRLMWHKDIVVSQNDGIFCVKIFLSE